MDKVVEMSKSGYSVYNKDYKSKVKVNTLNGFQILPNKKYQIIYADPPWDYGGKMQYDKSCIKDNNVNFDKHIFISAAEFKYPTLKLEELKTLNVQSISDDNCLLFMWTTGPQLANSIELGTAWGFEYKTVGFVWDKQIHNPGRYTLSQTEMCLIFKKGCIPSPRGARNIKQLVSVKRTKHSEKPLEIIEGITKMFPTQDKIELFARRNYENWDCWGIEIPNSDVEIKTGENT